MKKFSILLTSGLLTLSLLLVSIGSVSAFAPASSLPDPVVTPVSGDMVFTSELVSTASLPGVTSMSSGMLVPVGFPAGEKQFEGDAVKVSGFDSGKATACFATTGTSVGWGGQVGMWNGTQWVLLPTTITSPAESSFSWACASITNSGIYAFIRWVADVSLLPNKSACNYGIINAYGSASDSVESAGIETGHIGLFQFVSTTDLTGKTVTVTLLSSVPDGDYTWAGSATGVIVSDGGGNYHFVVSPLVPFYFNFNTTSITFHLDFGSCTQDFTESQS
jgi:hypothetical protein